MRVAILQENLAKALSIVSRAVDARPTLPVLGNVLLTAEDGQLRLAATNLEVSIATRIGAKVEESGSITLPAKTVTELVSNLSPERVDLTLDKGTQTVNLRCGTTNANIRGINADEFPAIPNGGDDVLQIAGNVLREMIDQTVFAIAREDSRPILTGVYFELKGKVMTMAASDGYRLAVRTTALADANFARTRNWVIPGKTMAELARIIGDDGDDVGISLPGEHGVILFRANGTDLSSQLLDGRYPDFTGIIPKSYSTSATAYTTTLLRACKRAEIFARESNYSARVIVKPPKAANEPGEIMIVGKSAERGDSEGMIDAAVEGEPLEAAFNIRYMIDVLNALSSERVILESNGAAHAGVIRSEDREDFVAVIMPMSIGR